MEGAGGHLRPDHAARNGLRLDPACRSRSRKRQQGVSPTAVFGLSLLFVFLILAAQYESWSLPFSVLLGTPVAVFGRFPDAVVAAISTTTFTPRSAWSC